METRKLNIDLWNNSLLRAWSVSDTEDTQMRTHSSASRGGQHPKGAVGRETHVKMPIWMKEVTLVMGWGDQKAFCSNASS